jgi:hypothetical protein
MISRVGGGRLRRRRLCRGRARGWTRLRRHYRNVSERKLEGNEGRRGDLRSGKEEILCEGDDFDEWDADNHCYSSLSIRVSYRYVRSQ